MSDKLTPQEAARRLGVHPSTLRRWDTDGALPASRTVGGHRRFDATDVDELADELADEAAWLERVLEHGGEL